MKCLFAGSFDPVTKGHIDIINRISAMYEAVYVGVAVNPSKSSMFSVEQRIAFIKNQISAKNVFPVVVNGLVSEFAYANSIDVLVRGIRNSGEFDPEFTMATLNRDISGVETVFIPATRCMEGVSSSIVKGIAKERGDISRYVSTQVKHHVEFANGMSCIAVVGNSGCGKSSLVKYLVDEINSDEHKPGYPAFNMTACRIDLDSIAHEVYTSNEPYAVDAKRKLYDVFGVTVVSRMMKVDRKNLANLVFNDPESLNTLNDVMRIPIKHMLYRKLREIPYNSLVFIDGAVIAEQGFMSFCNNNVINVSCDRDISIKRIMKRDLIVADKAAMRIDSQLGNDERVKLINNQISVDDYGSLFNVDTTEMDMIPSNMGEFLSVIYKMGVPA